MGLFGAARSARNRLLDRLARSQLESCGPDTVLACRVNRHLGGEIHVGRFSYVMGILQTHRPESRIHIGSNVIVNARTVVEATSSVEIGDDCLIAFEVVITDTAHHSLHWNERRADQVSWRATGTRPDVSGRPVVIEDGVWVGARSIILPGVRIGRGSTIGAASVVTGDIPEFSIAAGNPARVISQVEPRVPEGDWP